MTQARTTRLSGNGEEELYQMAMGFVAQSTAHGLPKVARSDSCKGRVFWLTIIIGALIMFCIQCVFLFQRFLSFPKTVGLEVINQPVPFPAVSICNQRPLDLFTFVDTLFDEESVLRWKVGQDFDYEGRPNSSYPLFEEYLVRYGHSYISYFHFAQQTRLHGGDPAVGWQAENLLYSRMTLAANFDPAAGMEGSTQKDQFIAKCEYAGEQCTPANFTSFLDPAYFSCYTFDVAVHSDKAYNTIYEGPDHGLSLVLFVPGIKIFNLSGEALDTLALGQDLSLGGEGIRLVIHEQNTVPYPITDGLDVPRGVSASVGINMAQNVRLGPPYGNCTSRQTLDGSVNYSYTMASCKKYCLQQLVIEGCGCADISLPLPLNQNTSYCAAFDPVPETCKSEMDIKANLTKCTPHMRRWFTRMACMKSIRSNISKNLSAWANCHCVPRCEDADYNYFLSLSDWPMAEQSMRILTDVLWTEDFLATFPPEKALTYFGPLMTKPTTFDEYADQISQKNFLRVNVYISDTSIVKIEEMEAYGFTQLVSDLGGQLGLWIGVSIISIVELFDILLQLSTFAVGRLCVPKRLRDIDSSPPDTPSIPTMRPHRNNLVTPSNGRCFVEGQRDTFHPNTTIPDNC